MSTPVLTLAVADPRFAVARAIAFGAGCCVHVLSCSGPSAPETGTATTSYESPAMQEGSMANDLLGGSMDSPSTPLPSSPDSTSGGAAARQTATSQRATPSDEGATPGDDAQSSSRPSGLMVDENGFLVVGVTGEPVGEEAVAGASTGGTSAGVPADVAASSGGGQVEETPVVVEDLGPVTFAEIEAYLIGNCSTSTACHGSGSQRVTLLGAGAHDTLMTLTVDECDGQTMVVPYDPESSAFYNMLTGGCGSFAMPPQCRSAECTGAEKIARVERWIRDGASE